MNRFSDDMRARDKVDVAWLSGHGPQTKIQFSTDHDTGTHDEEVHYSEVEWGDDDLEWIICHACYMLDDSTYTNWNPGFDGVHGICSFESAVDIVSTGYLGEYSADYFTDGNHAVYEAWEDATTDTLDSSNKGAIYSAIGEDEGYYYYHAEDLGDPLDDYYTGAISLYGFRYDKWTC